MKVHQTPLAGVLLLEPTVYRDERGFFVESYSARALAEHGITASFVQDNHSRSVKGTVRGLHYQINPDQAKLVRVIAGEVFDVAVDIRRGSPTYGQWYGQILSADNFLQLWIPAGFAHGFCVLSDTADLAYKVDTYRSVEGERGIAWNDPQIGIPWPVRDPILSARDKQQPLLSEAGRDFVFEASRAI